MKQSYTVCGSKIRLGLLKVRPTAAVSSYPQQIVDSSATLLVRIQYLVGRRSKRDKGSNFWLALHILLTHRPWHQEEGGSCSKLLLCSVATDALLICNRNTGENNRQSCRARNPTPTSSYLVMLRGYTLDMSPINQRAKQRQMRRCNLERRIMVSDCGWRQRYLEPYPYSHREDLLPHTRSPQPRFNHVSSTMTGNYWWFKAVLDKLYQLDCFLICRVEERNRFNIIWSKNMMSELCQKGRLVINTYMCSPI